MSSLIEQIVNLRRQRSLYNQQKPYDDLKTSFANDMEYALREGLPSDIGGVESMYGQKMQDLQSNSPVGASLVGDKFFDMIEGGLAGALTGNKIGEKVGFIDKIIGKLFGGIG